MYNIKIPYYCIVCGGVSYTENLTEPCKLCGEFNTDKKEQNK